MGYFVWNKQETNMMKKTWCFLLSLMGMVVVLSCRPDVNDRLMDRAKACVET